VYVEDSLKDDYSFLQVLCRWINLVTRTADERNRETILPFSLMIWSQKNRMGHVFFRVLTSLPQLKHPSYVL